jgi:pimeloyl-ACP methyl ester carboxylesterase
MESSGIWRLGLAVLVLAASAGCYLAGAFFAQRSVLFPARLLPSPRPVPAAEIIALSQPAGPVEALFLNRLDVNQAPAPLLIFTHGNGELADDWIGEFDEPRTWGWAVLLVEYPGYGRSAGRPSEAAIHAGARAALEWARRDPRVDASRIVAYGRSVGGGAAARLAADHQLPGLILESAFTSLRPLAVRYLVPGFLVRDPFDNLEALSRYEGALLVLHGIDDRIIPVAHGRVLARRWPAPSSTSCPAGTMIVPGRGDSSAASSPRSS